MWGRKKARAAAARAAEEERVALGEELLRLGAAEGGTTTVRGSAEEIRDDLAALQRVRARREAKVEAEALAAARAKTRDGFLQRVRQVELSAALEALESAVDADPTRAFIGLVELSNDWQRDPNAWSAVMVARAEALARVIGTTAEGRAVAGQHWLRRALHQPRGALGDALRTHKASIAAPEVLAWAGEARTRWSEVALEVAPGVVRVPLVVAAVLQLTDSVGLEGDSEAVVETAAMLRADGTTTCVEALEVARALEDY